MKWMYGINQKIKVAVASIVIVIIFFAINWIDKKNVNTLNSSFSSVFEDRLMVESYIFSMTDHLYQKKILLSTCGNYLHPEELKIRMDYHNRIISSLLADYEKTRLTKSESRHFADLKISLKEIQKMEEEYLHESGTTNSDPFTDGIQKRFELVLNDLYQLSRIQIEEGKILNDQSKK